jgi:hypothetical protein
MKRQTIFIIAILAVGISGIAYATGTVITDTYIVTPTLNATTINVSGTCNGCGVSEGSYSTYSLFLNKTVAGSTFDYPGNIEIGTDGSTYYGSLSGNTYLINPSGVIVGESIFTTAAVGTNIVQSVSGEYKILQDNNGTVGVFKNNVLLQSITADTTHSFNSATSFMSSISPNGQYVVLTGQDENGANIHIQLWKGS